jgi:hypothetical protein
MGYKSFSVTWEMDDVEGKGIDTAEDAVREALRIQRDPKSMATVFRVFEYREDGTTIDHGNVDGYNFNEEK